MHMLNEVSFWNVKFSYVYLAYSFNGSYGGNGLVYHGYLDEFDSDDSFIVVYKVFESKFTCSTG